MCVQLGEARRNAAALVWYLKRPSLHRELLRRVVRRTRFGRTPASHLEMEREEATRWCRSVETDRAALAKAIGLPAEAESVRARHPGAWNEALQAAQRCPVPMGGPGHVDLIYEVCRQIRPKVAIETGVAFGWSTLALLLAMQESPDSHLYSVDMPYATRENDAWVGCVVPNDLRSRWTLIRKPDRDAIPEIVRAVGIVDFAHYDSDKSYDGRLFAYELLFRHLRPGGILMSDDVDDNLGFRDFAAGRGLQPFVIRRPDGGYAGLIQA
jgi:predicted O-methyltransferase YrrM